jgi:class 3 adenylate cyclase
VKKIKFFGSYLFIPPVIIWVTLFVPFFSGSCSSDNEGLQQSALHGILDAKGEARLIFLSGEWEFYPNQFLNPGEFEEQAICEFLEVPGYWEKTHDGNDVTYGTYRLRLTNHNLPKTFSIRNRQIFSSFILYVNNTVVLKNGHVSAEADHEIPSYLPQVASVYATSDTLEFIVHVSNHHHRAGGIAETFVIGSPQIVSRNFLVRTGFDFFLLGSLLIMGIYYLSLFLALRKEVSSLYFGLFILISVLRILTTGQRLLANIFPSISWEMMLKLEYGTFYLAPAFFVLFFHAVFREEVRIGIVYISTIVSAIFTLIAIFFPVSFFAGLLPVFQGYVVILGLMLIFWLARAIRNKKEGALVLMFGFVFFFLVMVHDMAFVQGIVKGTELFPFGIFLFILCQSYILSIKYSDMNKENQALWKELDFKNQHLEQMVIDRTQQLENQKDLLQKTNLELEQKREMMIHQSRLMEDINELLEKEKEKTDQLLLNVLPRNIANELKLFGKSIAHSYPNVSVLFVDFVGFSVLSENINPEELLNELHFYFTSFDDIARKYNLEKIKTIGDAWMCAGGLREDASDTDVKNTVMAALEINMFVQSNKDERLSLGDHAFDCRIGIHTGPVIAGVVGKSKFSFDIWGPTVNIAKRMEAACEPGRVNISEFTYQHIKNEFDCLSRGIISMKHKKNMQMFFVEKPKINLRMQTEKLAPER